MERVQFMRSVHILAIFRYTFSFITKADISSRETFQVFPTLKSPAGTNTRQFDIPTRPAHKRKHHNLFRPLTRSPNKATRDKTTGERLPVCAWMFKEVVGRGGRFFRINPPRLPPFFSSSVVSHARLPLHSMVITPADVGGTVTDRPLGRLLALTADGAARPTGRG